MLTQGEDAFRPDLYGPAITIERRITATGHTSWCLKDHRGRKVRDCEAAPGFQCSTGVTPRLEAGVSLFASVLAPQRCPAHAADVSWHARVQEPALLVLASRLCMPGGAGGRQPEAGGRGRHYRPLQHQRRQPGAVPDAGAPAWPRAPPVMPAHSARCSVLAP